MEWLFSCYWASGLDPTAWWRHPATTPSAEPTDNGQSQPGDLDLDLVRIIFGVLVEQIACAVCGAPFELVSSVVRIRGLFTARRIVVVTFCRGPVQHRHLAKVVDRSGDLWWGQLRPA